MKLREVYVATGKLPRGLSLMLRLAKQKIPPGTITKGITHLATASKPAGETFALRN